MIKASLTESARARRAGEIYINTNAETGVRCERNTKVEKGVSAQTSANIETDARNGFGLSVTTDLKVGTGVNTNIDITAAAHWFPIDGTVCEFDAPLFDVPLINIPSFEGSFFSQTIRSIASQIARFIDHPKPQSGSA